MGRNEKLSRFEAEVPGGRIAKKKPAERYGNDRYRGSPVTDADMDLIIAVKKRREQLRKKRKGAGY